MSETLCWRPMRSDRNTLPSHVARVLKNKYEGLDNVIIQYGEIPYLEGLRDAGLDGAQELIDAVNDHGPIQLFLD